jgi:hypothetical protein
VERETRLLHTRDERIGKSGNQGNRAWEIRKPEDQEAVHRTPYGGNQNTGESGRIGLIIRWPGTHLLIAGYPDAPLIVQNKGHTKEWKII